MNKIVILCGANSCGKTTTMKGLFGIPKKADSPEYYVEKKLDGKTVCAVSFSSPQEQVHDFCNFSEVQKNINQRIIKSDEKATTKPYFLIIPFTMSGSRKEKKKVNKDCILKPIEELRKSHKVFVIYLRKTKTHHRKEKDALIEEIALIKDVEVIGPPILTTKSDYDKSKELEKVLREKILK
jgi:ABC-type cobalamin/Fe3+-siderophores transport system ATPase subunit